MPHLSIPQAVGLATWSFGMVMTKSSSLTQVSKFIASINQEKPNTVRLLSLQRAERLWLAFALDVGAAIALATLWMVILGGQAENQSPPPNSQQLFNKHIAFSKAFNPKPLRQISCFLLGFITLIAELLNGLSIHLHRWSSFPPTPVDAFYYSHSSSSSNTYTCQGTTGGSCYVHLHRKLV